MDERIEKLMHNLKERQFKPFYAEKRQDVIPLVRSLIKRRFSNFEGMRRRRVFGKR